MLEYQGEGAERRLYSNTVEMTLAWCDIKFSSLPIPRSVLTTLHLLRRHRSRSRRWSLCRKMTFLEVISICKSLRIYNLVVGTYHCAHNLRSAGEKLQSIGNPCDIYNVVGCDQN